MVKDDRFVKIHDSDFIKIKYFWTKEAENDSNVHFVSAIPEVDIDDEHRYEVKLKIIKNMDCFNVDRCLMWDDDTIARDEFSSKKFDDNLVINWVKEALTPKYIFMENC